MTHGYRACTCGAEGLPAGGSHEQTCGQPETDTDTCHHTEPAVPAGTPNSITCRWCGEASLVNTRPAVAA